MGGQWAFIHPGGVLFSFYGNISSIIHILFKGIQIHGDTGSRFIGDSGFRIKVKKGIQDAGSRDTGDTGQDAGSRFKGNTGSRFVRDTG